MSQLDEFTFFEMLGRRAGSRQLENQLSSTFVACATESPEFRRVAIDLLREQFGLPKVKRVEDWTVVSEESTPTKGGGRPDICVRTRSAGRKRDEIWLENKVEAVLTEQQVQKYVKFGVKRLAVITKYHPDVSLRVLRKLGVRAIRWQEVHGALQQVRPRTGVGRRLIVWFVQYLEALGMATATDLRLKDLHKLARAFEIARLERGNRWLGAAGFEAAGNLVNLLRGLRIRLVDRFPQLEGYRRDGPLYGCLDDGDGRSRYHSFSVKWRKGRGGSERAVFFSVNFPVGAPAKPEWGVGYQRGGGKDKLLDYGGIKSICSNGTLDSDKFFGHIASAFNKARVV